MDADPAAVTEGGVVAGAAIGDGAGDGPGSGAGGVAGAEALGDWRRDAVLLCLLPAFCWPAVVAAVLTRPVMLVVLLGPVLLGAHELRAVRRVRRVLRDPSVRWVPYEAEVVRARWRPPVVVLGEGRHALTLGVLGRRALPPRPWPRREPAPAVRVVRLAGDPARGGVLWIPDARRLGLARPARLAPRAAAAAPPGQGGGGRGSGPRRRPGGLSR
ncbi:hypothetical protein [Streptomyces yangpuensis]|uniref:hypothetical protein n=1 Tax=Streptomyces yangpuensis TaxID=1648182 RepID=UPI00364EF11A